MKRVVIVFVLVLAACDGVADVSTTTSMGSADTTTTQGQQIADGGLIPEDPPTLIPLEGANPIVAGLSHRGVVSPNRMWAAIETELATGSPGAMVSIVNMATLDDVASAVVDASSLVVNDDGRAFFFVDSRLMTLGSDGALAGVDSPEAPWFLHDTLADLGVGRIGYLASSEAERSNVRLVVSDVSGQFTETELSITAGPVADDTQAPHLETIVPGVAWTTDAAYVVSAEANELTVVDLTTGETDEHDFEGADETFNDYVERSVWVSASGILFVSTSFLDVAEDDEGWQAVETPGMLVVVDTNEWTSAVNDINVDTLFPSPTGEVVAAMGTLTEWSSTQEATFTQGPVYLIDTGTGEPLVGFQGNSGTIVDVQFSPSGAEMYVISTSELGTNIDVVDVATQTLAGNVAFTRISLIGEAGLMAFHSTID